MSPIIAKSAIKVHRNTKTQFMITSVNREPEKHGFKDDRKGFGGQTTAGISRVLKTV